MECFDVAILGGGAAGLLAAIRSAELGRSTVVLEKNRRPGVKILISGGTRCNLTNARGLRDLKGISGPVDPGYDPREARGARSILAAFGPQGSFLGPALKALSVEATIALFENEGLSTKVEANGKVFPATDRAADVLSALMKRVERSGARVRTGSAVGDVTPWENGYLVQTAESSIRARSVVLAMGGLSYPGCGTTGDGFGIARSLGHSIVEPRPALVPLRVEPAWVSELRGIALQDVKAEVRIGGVSRLERREAVLFAHFGLSGPAILDVSRAVARHDGTDRPVLVLDLLPGERAEAIEARLQAEARSGRSQVVGLLPDVLPRRLAESVLSAAEVPSGRIGPELSRDERKRLISCLKGLKLPVTGTLGFAKAEVTSGGVALEEVDPSTLESRIRPGLFFAGEVLDLDGLIGGYNFQAAWSTGWLAGERAAGRVSVIGAGGG